MWFSLGVPKALVVNVRETQDFAYCAYCSTVVGKVDADCVMFERVPIIPYFHDTMLRNCGLYHGSSVDSHAHYYELVYRPVMDMVEKKKLVVRILNSHQYGNGNICSSFEERRIHGSKGVYKRYDQCEPDSVTNGLVLAPSITSNLVIIESLEVFFAIFY